MNFFILLLFASLIPVSKSVVCAEYSQKLISICGINASEPPSNFVVVNTNCKGCVGSIKDGIFSTTCVRKNSDFGICLCHDSKELNCNGKSCCCHEGLDCYDRLRNHFAKNKAIGSTSCLVQRKTLLETSTGYLRTSCSICVAEYRHEAIESRCVEHNDFDNECSSANELIGGDLACTKDNKKCCCRGANDCQKQFEVLFFKQGKLGKSRIAEPYKSKATSPTLMNFAIFWMFIDLYFLYKL